VSKAVFGVNINEIEITDDQAVAMVCHVLKFEVEEQSQEMSDEQVIAFSRVINWFQEKESTSED
jgi:hypothetical protein